MPVKEVDEREQARGHVLQGRQEQLAGHRVMRRPAIEGDDNCCGGALQSTELKFPPHHAKAKTQTSGAHFFRSVFYQHRSLHGQVRWAAAGSRLMSGVPPANRSPRGSSVASASISAGRQARLVVNFIFVYL